MHGSFDMEHDRQNFLLFWAMFCPFTPLTTRKIKILKKWKKSHVVRFLRSSAQKADGQTDGRLEKVTYRDGYIVT